MTNNPAIHKEITKTHLKAILYDNGIVEILWDTSITMLEVVHLAQMRETLYELGGGKKMPLFFTAHDFLEVSEAGRRDAASEEGVKYTMANAVLVDSLAKKIAMNFFLNFNKPKAPTKGFSTKEEAFLWLESIRKKSRA